MRLHDELVDVEDEMQTYTEYKADAGDVGAKNLMGIRRWADSPTCKNLFWEDHRWL